MNVPMDLEQQLSSCLVALAEKKAGFLRRSELPPVFYGPSVSNLLERPIWSESPGRSLGDVDSRGIQGTYGIAHNEDGTST